MYRVFPLSERLIDPIRYSKTLASGVVDSFSVIVPTSTRNDAKKKYESMGYAVSVGR